MDLELKSLFIRLTAFAWSIVFCVIYSGCLVAATAVLRAAMKIWCWRRW